MAGSRARRPRPTLAAAAQERLDGLSAQQKGNTGRRKTDIAEEVEAQETLIEAVERQTEVQRMAAETANVQSQIFLDLINSTSGVTVEVDELNNRLYTLPDGKQILIDAATGQATANLDTFKGDLDGVPDTVTSTVRLEVDDSAWRNYTPQRKRGEVDVWVTGNGRQIL